MSFRGSATARTMIKTNRFDAITVDGGNARLGTSAVLQEAGKSIAFVEGHEFVDICPNRGCTPKNTDHSHPPIAGDRTSLDARCHGQRACLVEQVMLNHLDARSNSFK